MRLFQHLQIASVLLILLQGISCIPIINKRQLITRVHTASTTNTITTTYSTTTKVVIAPTVYFIIDGDSTSTSTEIPDNVDPTALPTTTIMLEKKHVQDLSFSLDNAATPTTPLVTSAATTTNQLASTTSNVIANTISSTSTEHHHDNAASAGQNVQIVVSTSVNDGKAAITTQDGLVNNAMVDNKAKLTSTSTSTAQQKQQTEHQQITSTSTTSTVASPQQTESNEQNNSDSGSNNQGNTDSGSNNQNNSNSDSNSQSSSSSSDGSKLTSTPHALAYSPYNGDGSCRSASDIAADLQNIKNKGVSQLRIYGTDCNSFETVLPTCVQLGLKVNQGLWIGDAGVDSLDDGLSLLIQYGQNNGWDIFEYITIGNEAINSGYCSVTDLINKISSVKSQLNNAGYSGRITTSEPPVTFENHPELCTSSEIDFAGINPHSYFDVNSSAETSGTFVKGQLEIVQNICGNVVITETGYPSQGSQNGGNIPTKANQLVALQAILNEVGSEVTILTYTDDFWKNPGPYGIEQYFGIGDLLN